MNDSDRKVFNALIEEHDAWFSERRVSRKDRVSKGSSNYTVNLHYLRYAETKSIKIMDIVRVLKPGLTFRTEPVIVRNTISGNDLELAFEESLHRMNDMYEQVMVSVVTDNAYPRFCDRKEHLHAKYAIEGKS